MNKLRFVMMWCLLLGILVSCGDKEDDASPAAAVELDYLPDTKGSTWNYGGTNPYSLTATGNTKVVDGKTYSEFETKQGNETRKSYLLKEKGVYTGIGMDPSLSNDISLTFLKEETPVGKAWYQTNTINGFETKMTFTIIAKDITKTVEGKTYKEVIHVQAKTSVIFMDMEIDSGVNTNYYWAKGVGLILTDAGQHGNIPLMTYSIK
ncbi:hypothetical protein [Pontibacter sp. BAB1700]|uniref:hypothetical protein n=1 Tax=Pontibacter sp. BAB1700 TaxID=1144253 RepID=UPI00026BD1AD|nr:hypothetical protein [Pontibacter sp. BAB1700]EJF10959.1 hypothetical protein O71_06167 [Pontibacter sp. BAB1700]